MSLIENIEKNKRLIFILELAGLLHDTGKLSSEFIYYRRRWQKKTGMNDPHEDNFFDKDNLLSNEYLRPLNECLNKKISSYAGSTNIYRSGFQINTVISLKNLMYQHTKPKDEIAQFLKLGDAVDTRDDRNNPLMVMEQTTEQTFGSTVFGYETLLNVEDFDNIRKILYNKLNYMLPKYLDSFHYKERIEIFKAVEEAFNFALTDTNRPANDITLWQHSYVTAALSKVFFNHFLIYGEKIQSLDRAKFSLIGFGWDGMAFISDGQKIGDIVAKKRTIKLLKEKIKQICEYQYPICANIYDDDNGIYFIAPAIRESASEYIKLLSEIKTVVDDAADEITGGEIQPVFTDISDMQETNFVMEIVHTIKRISEKSKYPYQRLNHKLSWMRQWDNVKEKTICSVCRKRPSISTQYSVCNICKERRIWEQKQRNDCHSIFSDEIADKNGKLALIVAKFSLEPWLSGDMLWSLFVKEAKSIKEAIQHLEKINDFKENDKNRKDIIEKNEGKDIVINYEKISEWIDRINKAIDGKSPITNKEKDFLKAISYLFDKHRKELQLPENWQKIKDWIKNIDKKLEIEKRFGNKPNLCNFLLTKNHTPSRLLNVWNTTRKFLENLFDLRTLENKKLIAPFRRLKLKLKNSGQLQLENAIYEAEINGIKIDIYRAGDNIFVVNEGYKETDFEVKRQEWEGKLIRIKASEFEKEKNEIQETTIREVLIDDKEIYPLRVITTTPDIMMAIVPADKAIPISDYIYSQYKEYFGKVIGRLSFNIGNIFFHKKVPMFVILDSGKRMLKNFENLNKDYWKEKSKNTWTIKDVKNEDCKTKITFDKQNISWDINYNLGMCKEDYFHPYMVKKSSEGDTHKEEASFVKSFMGDLVHISDLKSGYKVRVYPNYYDFEFLDCNTRRHDIHLNKDNRRKSNVGDFKSKPFLLDELSQKIMYIWDELLKGKQLEGITDTKLRDLQSLWLTKYKEWGVSLEDKTSDSYQIWISLITASIQKEFKVDDKQQSLLLETIDNGLFFDTLELYPGILKERIDEQNKGGV